MQLIAALPYPGTQATTDDDASLASAAFLDSAAFGMLYQRYRDRVYRYLLSRSYNTEDASDLTQQVFLRALDSLSAFQPRRGAFAAWLFTIARNAAIDLQRHRRFTAPDEPSLAALFSSLEEGPEAHALHREDLDRLRALLTFLEPQKREILALRFAGCLPIADIAVEIGKSRAATSKQLSRTIQALQEVYDAR